MRGIKKDNNSQNKTMNKSAIKKRNKKQAKSLMSSDRKISKKKNIRQKFILIFSGAIIGLINGFFGGGGGMICVPILQRVLDLDAKHSHATAIVVIFPLSLMSACVYIFNGFISSMPLLTIGLGVVVGGIVGAFALKILPPKAIRLIFALIMFAGGIKLII